MKPQYIVSGVLRCSIYGMQTQKQPQYIDLCHDAYTIFCIDILGSNDYDKKYKIVYTGGQSYENKD